VFLDRDGVLLRTAVEGGTPHPAADVAAAEILPGVGEALRRLKAHGFLTIVVSNQPDVARGKQPRQRVEEINAWLGRELELDACYVCYHDDPDGCACRKPRPGLLLAAARDFGIELAGSYMVGDRWRDVDAGAAAGCRTILIDYAYGERSPEHPPWVKLSNLSQAADWILRQALEVVSGQGSVIRI